MSGQRTGFWQRDSVIVFGSAAAIALVGIVLAYQLVDPAPPRRFAIAAGAVGGAYHAYALRYRSILARHGVELEVLATAGSLENLERLRAADARVQVGFVQGGTAQVRGGDSLVSLASLYFEPLWVFHRASLTLGELSDLVSRRVAVGAAGSGTRAVAIELLEANGVSGKNADLASLAAVDAARALRAGEVDAAFIVSGADSPLVRELLQADGIALMSFERASTYTRLYRYLSAVTLPRGAVDLVRDLPPRDTRLIAPTAALVARSDFHPALIDLLMGAISEVHRPSGLFEDYGQFPSPKHLEFPLSDEARRYFDSGPTFLRRVLPFWAATLVERLAVMLLPLAALLIPLVRALPPVYRWRIRSRIYRWYSELLSIDPVMRGAERGASIEAAMRQLARIEDEVAKVKVPMSYADQLYALRFHIELVRQKLNETADSRADRDTVDRGLEHRRRRSDGR